MEDWKLCQEFSSYLKAILPLARLIIYIYIYNIFTKFNVLVQIVKYIYIYFEKLNYHPK
jgi:hypothetical protein